jgi:ornithine cyclodeaminase
MPAFTPGGGGVVKLATVFPDNASRDTPTIHAVIVVFSDEGAPTAILDGTVVTRLRTGAASALASQYLSRADSQHLVIIGTGSLAPYMAWAHATVRPIRRITVCGRSLEHATRTMEHIRALMKRDIDIGVSISTERAVGDGDIVCCCTSSAIPVLAGRWLRPGTFVDLVGSFSPLRRETDDDVVRSARIFVDTLEGALTEAGDLLDPLERGVLSRDRIEGELTDLVRGTIAGRAAPEDITLFKSVGSAIEDLAACSLLMQAADANPV